MKPATTQRDKAFYFTSGGYTYFFEIIAKKLNMEEGRGMEEPRGKEKRPKKKNRALKVSWSDPIVLRTFLTFLLKMDEFFGVFSLIYSSFDPVVWSSE